MATRDVSHDFHVLLNALTPADLVEVRKYIDGKLTPEHLRQANLQLSPLLQLPADILEYIIDLAVRLEQDIHIRRDYQLPSEPSIVLTCQHLRRDALRLYYSHNIFAVQRSRREEFLQRWIDGRVGRSRRYLRQVRLGAPLHCSNEDAAREAAKLDVVCGLRAGTVWTLSEDDFENDFEWWVNSKGVARRVVVPEGKEETRGVDAGEGDAGGSSLERWLGRVERSESDDADGASTCSGYSEQTDASGGREETRKGREQQSRAPVELVPTPKSLSSDSR